MKLFKKTVNVSLMLAIFCSFFNCAVQKESVSNQPKVLFQEKPVFQLNEANFQEWYAGINVGGTGFNVFLSNIANDENVILESVYFRNLVGTLVKDNGKYAAILKNQSTDYTWQYPVKPADYPFDLTPDECVVSYKENGETKFYKIASITEKAGTYYENGPSIYEPKPITSMATVDEN